MADNQLKSSGHEQRKAQVYQLNPSKRSLPGQEKREPQTTDNNLGKLTRNWNEVIQNMLLGQGAAIEQRLEKLFIPGGGTSWRGERGRRTPAVGEAVRQSPEKESLRGMLGKRASERDGESP